MSNPRDLKPRTPGEPVQERQMPPQEPVKPTIDLSNLSDDEIIAMAVEARRRKEKRGDTDLPDQAEIDPATIKRAVLTKQGWVCPLESDIAKRNHMK